VKIKRIDEYICINIEKIIEDELRDILSNDIDKLSLEEDKKYYKKLQDAVKIVLKYYTV